MRIFDCFCVFNEIDIVDARLKQWAGVPNVHHIAAEGHQTFRGEPKHLNFQGNPLFADRSIAIVAVDGLTDPDPWVNEKNLRDSLRQILDLYLPSGEDLIILSDADEIVRTEALPEILVATEISPVILELRMHYYSSRWVAPYPWGSFVKAFRWRDRHFIPDDSFTEFRHHGENLPVLHDMGWHLSHWGGAARVQDKIRSGSHTEISKSAFEITEMIQNGYDVHGTKLLEWTGEDMPL